MTVSAASSPWIITRRDDLLFFIGSALIGYGLMAVVLGAGTMPAIAVWMWSIGLNSPHVFSTATRVLLDPIERAKIGRRWLLLLPLCLLGPLLLWAGGFRLLFLVTATWGHYHVSKQHMGFVLIYKRKAGQRSDFSFDKTFALISLLLPCLYYFAVLISESTTLLPLFVVPACVYFLVYLSRNLERASWPKTLLLGLTIPLTWLAFIYAAADVTATGRLVVAVMVTNVSHSIQYLRLMWFHNHNRYSERTGVLGMISKKWFAFFAIAFLLSLPAQAAEYHSELANAFAGGLLFFHYTVDAWIWRVRGDVELARALRL